MIISLYNNSIPLMMTISFSLIVFLVMNNVIRLLGRYFDLVREVFRKKESNSTRWPSLSNTGTPSLYGTRFYVLLVLSILVFMLSSLIGLGLLMYTFFPSIKTFLTRSKRKREIVRDLPVALSVLIASLRSGQNLQMSVRVLVGETTGVVSDVFAAVVRGMDLGLTLHDACNFLSDQIDLEEWNVLCSALELQKDTGGDIVLILTKIKNTLQDKEAVERELKTATASGKLSGLIVAGLAPVGLIFFHMFSPEYVSVLFTTETGRISLIIAAVLEIVGGYWVWKVTKLDF